MEEIIARCGYRCDLCPAYHKNIKDSGDRKRVSAGWKKYVGDDVPPDEVTCPGCLKTAPYQDEAGAPLRAPDPGCPVRPCVAAKAIDNCAHCPQFGCAKLNSRMNFFQKKYRSFEGIPERDFDAFIRPYLSRERLLRIRRSQSVHQRTNRRELKMSPERMLNNDVKPTEEDTLKHIGARAAPLWSSLREYLSVHYTHDSELDFGGDKYGWSIRYRKSGKTLVTLYPERSAFTALVVLGKKEVAKAEGLQDKLSTRVGRLLHEAEQLHDGRWLWIRPSSKADVESIKLLLSVKRQPKPSIG